MKVFETESKYRKPNPSFDLTADPVTLDHSCLYYLVKPNNVDCSEEHSCFGFLEKCPTASFESKKGNCGSYDSGINAHFAYQPLEDGFDLDRHFGHQLLKDEPEDDSIQSFNIVGRFCDQSRRSNVSPSPSTEFSLTTLGNPSKCEHMLCGGVEPTFAASLVDYFNHYSCHSCSSPYFRND